MKEEIKENEENAESLEKEDILEKEEVQEDNEAVEDSKEEENISEIDELKKRIEDLEKESFDFKDKYMRAMAEVENIRKRALKEKQETTKRANRNLLLSLLNFMDNFERAVKAAIGDSNIENSEYYQGIKLIHKQFIDFITEQGITEIEALDQDFDPNVHEALTMIEKPDITTEKVIEVYAKGYKLNDELLRTAKVVVAKPAN